MNLSNIKVGQTFKNYKELCSALGEPVKGGKSKQLQLKEWERYFSFTKQGHKITINEIYDTPKEKQDMRSYGNNTVGYIDYIEILLLNLFAEKAKQGQRDLLISKGKLLKLLKMINSNYLFFRDKTHKLSEYINIPEIEIKDFYESSNSTLENNLETALKRLRQKSLVYWTYAIGVCYLDTEIETNELGKIKINRYKKSYQNDYEDEEEQYIYEPAKPTKLIKRYRKATNDEIEIITKTENEILEKYGIITIPINEQENNSDQENEEINNKNEYINKLYKRGLVKDFYKKVNDLLFERANILYYYNAYEFVLNRRDINKNRQNIKAKLECIEKEYYEELLNDSIKDRIIENAKKRHKRALSFNDELLDWGYLPEYKEESIKHRRNPQYIENTITLTDTLIDKDNKPIDYNEYDKNIKNDT